MLGNLLILSSSRPVNRQALDLHSVLRAAGAVIMKEKGTDFTENLL